MTPTLESLARDPEWGAQLRKSHGLPKNLRHPGQTPWALWGLVATPDESKPGGWSWSWAQSRHSAYSEAWSAWVKSLKRQRERGEGERRVVDWSIVCLPRLWPQPLALELPPGTHWCPRCRRPVVWSWRTPSHALGPIARSQAALRCPWCGCREETAEPFQAWAIRSLAAKRARAERDRASR